MKLDQSFVRSSGHARALPRTVLRNDAAMQSKAMDRARAMASAEFEVSVVENLSLKRSYEVS